MCSDTKLYSKVAGIKRPNMPVAHERIDCSQNHTKAQQVLMIENFITKGNSNQNLL